MYDKMTEEKKDKDEKDKNSAEEMRRRSLETFKETRKINSEDKEYCDNGKKRPRSTGSEMLVYLRENAENMKEVREKEIALKEKQLDQQAAQNISMTENQQGMFLLMQQQMKQQKQSQQQQQLQQAMLQTQKQQSQQMQTF